MASEPSTTGASSQGEQRPELESKDQKAVAPTIEEILGTAPPAATTAPPKNTSTKKPEEFMKDGKVKILFKSTGNAKALKVKKFKLRANANFQNVIDFLRKQLKSSEPLFLFVNQTFQPHPEEVISDLFKCFHVNGSLVINYCTTAAWG